MDGTKPDGTAHVGKHAELQRCNRRKKRPKDRNQRPAHGIVGNSSAIRDLLRQARKYAVTPAPLLIRGERGTGKELFARFVHDASGRDGEFVALNCSTLPEELAEAELFGHTRGAFTGAGDARPGLFVAADGGTLLLDEVGDLSLQAQAKILRVLQEGTVRRLGDSREVAVDVRVVAATWRDLEQMMRDGSFREDLYDRLAWCRIDLPPLKDRGRDIILLAKHYLAHSRELAGLRKGLSRDAERILLGHPWPGNVRELQRTLFKAVVEGRGRRISAAHLRAVMEPGSTPGDAASGVPKGIPSDRLVYLLGELGEVRMADIEHATGGSRSNIKRLLSDLVARGVILRTGRGPATRYRLSGGRLGAPAGWDSRWSVAVAIVEQEGRITRSRLAQQLAISERTATRVLTAMVAATVLAHDGNRGKARGYLMA
jgi:DNA-binding NtrC family response regulator